MQVSGQGSQETDVELIRRYKESGDLTLLGVLYQRYMSLVYGVCLKYLKDREESQDAVMQVFERLITLLKEHEVDNFRGWLYVTARNHCLMHLRSTKGQHFEEFSLNFMESQADSHPDDELSRESNLRKLEECIDRLGTEQKTCVRMFYLQQKCYREISSSTGFNDKQVKSHIQNGRRNLKICMDHHG